MTCSLRHLGILALIGLVPACQPAPDLSDRITPQALAAPFPDLLPIDQILSASDRLSVENGGDATPLDLSARIDSLQARAQRLRGPVLSSAIRARLDRGIQG